MATVGQFYWPSVGIFVAAYGQFFMAANTQCGEELDERHPIPPGVPRLSMTAALAEEASSQGRVNV
jgi:H+/Cl- antiporter ClcA